jgi:hypothetical protein
MCYSGIELTGFDHGAVGDEDAVGDFFARCAPAAAPSSTALFTRRRKAATRHPKNQSLVNNK